jgi:hypothetical protein
MRVKASSPGLLKPEERVPDTLGPRDDMDSVAKKTLFSLAGI